VLSIKSDKAEAISLFSKWFGDLNTHEADAFGVLTSGLVSSGIPVKQVLEQYAEFSSLLSES
jgi:hypothetical protein